MGTKTVAKECFFVKLESKPGFALRMSEGNADTRVLTTFALPEKGLDTPVLEDTTL